MSLSKHEERTTASSFAPFDKLRVRAQDEVVVPLERILLEQRLPPPFAQASPARAGKNEIRTVKRVRPTARGAEIVAKSLPISLPAGNSRERQIDVINEAFARPVFTPISNLPNRANRSARRMSGFRACSGPYGRYANDKEAFHPVIRI